MSSSWGLETFELSFAGGLTDFAARRRSAQPCLFAFGLLGRRSFFKTGGHRSDQQGRSLYARAGTRTGCSTCTAEYYSVIVCLCFSQMGCFMLRLGSRGCSTKLTGPMVQSRCLSVGRQFVFLRDKPGWATGWNVRKHNEEKQAETPTETRLGLGFLCLGCLAQDCVSAL